MDQDLEAERGEVVEAHLGMNKNWKDKRIEELEEQTMHTVPAKDWNKLMAKIAEIDPQWAHDTEGEEPDAEDPQFQEQYDPWEGLRQIQAALAESQARVKEFEAEANRMKRLYYNTEVRAETAEARAEEIAGKCAESQPVLEAAKGEYCRDYAPEEDESVACPDCSCDEPNMPECKNLAKAVGEWLEAVKARRPQ